MSENTQIKDLSLKKRIKEYKELSTIKLKDFVVIEISFKNNTNILNLIKQKDYIELYKEFIKDISQRFQFDFIYFNNQKIITIIKPENINYKGNTNKILSNITSYITLNFNKFIYKYYLKIKKDIESSHFMMIPQKKINYVNLIETLIYDVSFEAEILNIPSKKEVFNTIMYYQNDYTYKSKISFLKDYNFVDDNVNITNIDTYLNILKEDTNYDWNDIHDYEKYGMTFQYEIGFKIIKQNLEFNKDFL